MQKVGSCLVSSQKSEKANVAGEEGAKGKAGGTGQREGRSYRASSTRLSLLTFLNPLVSVEKHIKILKALPSKHTPICSFSPCLPQSKSPLFLPRTTATASAGFISTLSSLQSIHLQTVTEIILEHAQNYVNHSLFFPCYGCFKIEIKLTYNLSFRCTT